MPFLTRREYFASLAILAAQPLKAQAPKGKRITLGFSNYGMKFLAPLQAIEIIRKTGFNSLELCLMPGWPTEAVKLAFDGRGKIKKAIQDSNLVLTALMEHLVPSTDPAQPGEPTVRLQQAFELARDLGGDHPPLVQTVLGGGDWEKLKEGYKKTLSSWVELAKKHQVVLAIKPHRSGAMSLPSQAKWLWEETGKSPWLKVVYDPSHLVFRGLDLEKELRGILPILGHVAVKDAVQKEGKVVFELAGTTGQIDYAPLLKTLKEAGYQGDINCEVSSMVSSREGYDPVSAAKTCQEKMSEFF
ncbi:MAG: sugar phosphate isomerase/epimerase [Gemmataceae bacterium]|nr:sugar phosphate isomerase/epimerase [Gemmataceae bacterium]